MLHEERRTDHESMYDFLLVMPARRNSSAGSDESDLDALADELLCHNTVLDHTSTPILLLVLSRLTNHIPPPTVGGDETDTPCNKVLLYL